MGSSGDKSLEQRRTNSLKHTVKGKPIETKTVESPKKPLAGGNGGTQGAGNAYKSTISDELKEKILYGQRKDLNKNELIGGHSPIISNSNPKYSVEVVSINADGTKKVKFLTEFEDGNVSKIKTSTLFPDSWSDKKIVDSIYKIGDTPSIGQRVTDGATLHRAVVGG
ncbi:EndoU domain-containing protein [Paenibacillus sp. FSL R7-0331]|uniref:EndoU domain-containing protein n=1 Tax=Paenibacillus sp. FSL R7-0331 TaxID=1536773 RepID=UPI001E35ECF7|nr:EndoU domain-containing protein [Paenibacillus sp. FSL R7-0331]